MESIWEGNKILPFCTEVDWEKWKKKWRADNRKVPRVQYQKWYNFTIITLVPLSKLSKNFRIFDQEFWKLWPKMLVFWKIPNFSRSIDYNSRNIWRKILKFLGQVVKDVKEIWEKFYEVRSRQVPVFCSRAKTARRQNDPNPINIISEFEKVNIFLLNFNFFSIFACE